MTKLLSLALAAVVATSGMAASQSGAPQGNIFVGNDRSSGDNARQVAFDRVDAPAAGVVEVGDYQLHQMGQPLGREAVDAGTNWNVRINVGRQRTNDLPAVLKVNGAVVDQQFVGNRN